MTSNTSKPVPFGIMPERFNSISEPKPFGIMSVQLHSMPFPLYNNDTISISEGTSCIPAIIELVQNKGD